MKTCILHIQNNIRERAGSDSKTKLLPFRGRSVKVSRSGWETMLHVVAAILRTLRGCDPRMLPVCSSIMIGEYPLRTRLVN